MSTLYDRIKNRREELNMSQEELANKLGYKSRSSINKIEKGENDIPQSKIVAFASALQTTAGNLMGWEETKEDTPRQYPFIPDAVAAGIPCTIEGRKDLPTIGISDAIMGKYAGNRHIIIMRVNGESMNKVIPNGSFVAIKTDVSVENLRDGDLVVFGKTHEYSLKHFYNAGDKVIFKPNSTDPTFADHVFDKDETIKIVGKVVLYMVGLV